MRGGWRRSITIVVAGGGQGLPRVVLVTDGARGEVVYGVQYIRSVTTPPGDHNNRHDREAQSVCSHQPPRQTPHLVEVMIIASLVEVCKGIVQSTL